MPLVMKRSWKGDKKSHFFYQGMSGAVLLLLLMEMNNHVRRRIRVPELLEFMGAASSLCSELLMELERCVGYL